QRELRRIQAAVHKTIVFVTHDIGEAFLLGDRIVLMRDGRVVQDSPPADLIRHPADPFVTSFIGEDRGLRALQYTTLSELAPAAPPPSANGPLPEGLVLPGSLSIAEALARLAAAPAPGDGFWISTANGSPPAHLTYRDLVTTLGEVLTEE